MEDIISGSVDIYAEFGVSADASASEVGRRFRQLARKYHPDKNPAPDAAARFHHYSVIHSVLSQPSLRAQYDEIRHSQQATHAGPAQDQISRFQAQLRQREREAQQARTHAPPTANTEALHLQGLALRRKLQSRLQQRTVHVSFRELKLPVYTDRFLCQTHKLQVVWKVRPERGATIDANVLARIMAQFGPVHAADTDPASSADSKNYGRGTVTFATAGGARRALQHNFKKSAHLWDGTPERKVASLLRSVSRAAPCETLGEPARSETLGEPARSGVWHGPKPWDAPAR